MCHPLVRIFDKFQRFANINKRLLNYEKLQEDQKTEKANANREFGLEIQPPNAHQCNQVNKIYLNH
jgi:hypothetical protein